MFFSMYPEIFISMNGYDLVLSKADVPPIVAHTCEYDM